MGDLMIIVADELTMYEQDDKEEGNRKVVYFT